MPRISRRRLLRRALLAAGLAGISLGLAQEEKASKIAVNYRPCPKDGKRCADCLWFISGEGETGRCEKVQGAIAPDGYCMLWMEADKSE